MDDVFARVTKTLTERKEISVIRPAKDGRLVRIASEPLEGGGWVATHEDVTERQQLLEVRERAEALARESLLNWMPRSIIWPMAFACTMRKAPSPAAGCRI